MLGSALAKSSLGLSKRGESPQSILEMKLFAWRWEGPVKSEQAPRNDLTSLGTPLGNGMVEDIPGEIERIQAQYDAAGFQTIVAEVERQFNEFLLENPYEGQ